MPPHAAVPGALLDVVGDDVAPEGDLCANISQLAGEVQDIPEQAALIDELWDDLGRLRAHFAALAEAVAPGWLSSARNNAWDAITTHHNHADGPF